MLTFAIAVGTYKRAFVHMKNFVTRIVVCVGYNACTVKGCINGLSGLGRVVVKIEGVCVCVSVKLARYRVCKPNGIVIQTAGLKVAYGPLNYSSVLMAPYFVTCGVTSWNVGQDVNGLPF